jgi:hypothetical protein
MVAIERERSHTATLSSGTDGIPAGAKRRTGSPGQVFAACAAGALVVALLSSPESPSWTERVGDQPFGAAAREAANAWNDRVARLGLTWPHQALRAIARRLSESQWR